MSYKFQRREKKLNKRRNRIKKHGKNTGKIYKDSIIKRLRKEKNNDSPAE